MKMETDGGYEEGYSASSCFWGTEPASLVRQFLADRNHAVDSRSRILDVGCGEGKNAVPFARLGYTVDAIDCSRKAIENGRSLFSSLPINWTVGNVLSCKLPDDHYDVAIAYGLLHCLPDQQAVELLIDSLQRATKRGGTNIVCTFNDRSHDLSAHPGFHPTLLPHSLYLQIYRGWKIVVSSDEDLFETHPHNGIPHHHSMTRIIAEKPNEHVSA